MTRLWMLIAMAGALAACAATTTAPPSAAMARWQWDAQGRALFYELDRDRDGRLTGPEMDALAGTSPYRLDGNADRSIDLGEFLGGRAAVFDHLDGNHDDRLAGIEVGPLSLLTLRF